MHICSPPLSRQFLFSDKIREQQSPAVSSNPAQLAAAADQQPLCRQGYQMCMTKAKIDDQTSLLALRLSTGFYGPFASNVHG